MINFVNLYIYHRKMCMNGSMNAIFQKKKYTDYDNSCAN